MLAAGNCTLWLPTDEEMMGAFPLLDTFLGLAFVYLLLALVCTTLMEWIAQMRNLRGTTLVNGTRQLLGDETLTTQLFKHPLIQSLGKDDRWPSYIPSGIFAKTLTDMMRPAPGNEHARAAPEAPKALQASFRALKTPEEPKRTVAGERAHEAAPAEADVLPSEQSLAEWFDRAMERVSGTYKRRTRGIILLLSAIITVVLNANSLTLVSNLWQSPSLRAVLVEQARSRIAQGPPLQTVEYTDPTNPRPTAPIAQDSSKSRNGLTDDETALLGQLFGWRSFWDGYDSARGSLAVAGWVLATLVGWAITALAVSLGAPFWFDTLNRFMKLRATGDVPPKTLGVG
jgi:hypothetical protein